MTTMVSGGAFAAVVCFVEKKPGSPFWLMVRARGGRRRSGTLGRRVVIRRTQIIDTGTAGGAGTFRLPPQHVLVLSDAAKNVSVAVHDSREHDIVTGMAPVYLFGVLARDNEADGPLQTLLLEMNLLGGAPWAVKAIFSSNMVHYFDRRPHVARLCEHAQLFQSALELYMDIKVSKRVIVNTNAINVDWLVGYFGSLAAESALACLEVPASNIRNLKVVVNIATLYVVQLGAEKVVAVLESYDSYDGLFYFLGSILKSSDSEVVFFKYIVAASKLGYLAVVERVCRESTVYDPVEVKEFLVDANLADPRPLIHVCDRYDFVDELAAYLWNNKLTKFIEVNLRMVSPAKITQVVGKLTDADADEPFSSSLLDSVGNACPAAALVDGEMRGHLRILQLFLEQRHTEPSTHDRFTINEDRQTLARSNQSRGSISRERGRPRVNSDGGWLESKGDDAGAECEEAGDAAILPDPDRVVNFVLKGTSCCLKFCVPLGTTIVELRAMAIRVGFDTEEASELVLDRKKVLLDGFTLIDCNIGNGSVVTSWRALDRLIGGGGGGCRGSADAGVGDGYRGGLDGFVKFVLPGIDTGTKLQVVECFGAASVELLGSVAVDDIKRDCAYKDLYWRVKAGVRPVASKARSQGMHLVLASRALAFDSRSSVCLQCCRCHSSIDTRACVRCAHARCHG